MSDHPTASQKKAKKNRTATRGTAQKTLDGKHTASAKRDNAYFAARLERENPEVWSAWQVGAYPSLRAACVSAGLVRRRSRSSELKNAWQKATVDEKIEFLEHLRVEGILRRAKGFELALPPRQSTKSAPEDADRKLIQPFPWKITENGRLTPEAKERILGIMRRRDLIAGGNAYRVGVVMEELGRGFKSQDPSLSHALKGGWRIRPELAKALEKWLVEQEKPDV